MTEDNMRYYNGIASFIGQTFGALYEISIYDTSTPEYELIASYNQEDNIVESVKKFVKDAVETKTYKNQGYYVGHPVPMVKSGIMKMSVCRLNNGEKAEAVMVVCMRCDSLFKAEAMITNMLGTNLGELMLSGADVATTDDKDYSVDFGLNKITEYIAEYGVERGRTKPYEREEIICDLYDLGVFNYKGAVIKVAEELGISDKSVYRLLAKIKASRV